MGNSEDREREVREFWANRANLGAQACTQDLLLKELEMAAIERYIQDGMRVLDVGCGNGMTALRLASKRRVDVVGIDYVPELIDEARRAARLHSLVGKAEFISRNLTDLDSSLEQFDVIYSERALINLPEWPQQQRAIERIADGLREGGVYVMCENSQDGLDRLNVFRSRLGLPTISPPWHNRYFREADLANAKFEKLTLDRVEHFTSTYYFLSRVINAWMANQDGNQPSYDAPINKLALEIPSIGDIGQTCIWVWRRTANH